MKMVISLITLLMYIARKFALKSQVEELQTKITQLETRLAALETT